MHSARLKLFVALVITSYICIIISVHADTPNQSASTPTVFDSPPVIHSQFSPPRVHDSLSHWRKAQDDSFHSHTPLNNSSKSGTPFRAAYSSESSKLPATFSSVDTPPLEGYGTTETSKSWQQNGENNTSIPLPPNNTSASLQSQDDCKVGYYYSETLVKKISLVCEQGTGIYLPSQHTIEIQRLTSRVQQLETELHFTKNRYDREISHYKREQELERFDHQHAVTLLQQQLTSEMNYTKHFQVAFQSLIAQLRKMEVRLSKYEGEDCVDGDSELEDSSIIGQEDYCSTVKSILYTLQKEIRQNQTKSVQESSDAPNATEISEKKSVEELSDALDEADVKATNPSREQVVLEILQKCHKLWMEKRQRMIQSLEEKRKQEVTRNSHQFLKANDKMSEVVSRSLECLSSISSTQCGSLEDELKCLQGEFETLRFASWP